MMFESFGRDLAFGWRQIRRQRNHAAGVLLILAMGTAATATAFAVMYQVLLKPLPYSHPEQLLFVHNVFPKAQVMVAGVSALDYAEISRHQDVFESSALYFFNDLTLTGAGIARHVDAVNASASLFDVLQAKARLGRVFTNSDDRFGAPRVLLLSDAFWRGAFGSDPNVVGRKVALNNLPYTVVGVMPARFRFPYPATQIWIPVAFRPGDFTELGRLEKWLRMIVRLAPGTSRQQAETALAVIARRLNERFPALYQANTGWHFSVRPVADEQTQAFRYWLGLGFAAALCLLLITCSNVSSLLLIRINARMGEMATRAALGASYRAILSQILTETAMLAFAGTGVGFVLAASLLSLVNRYGPLPEPATLDLSTAGFVLTLALASTVIAGLVPAVMTANISIETLLRTSAARTSSRRSTWAHIMVSTQIAVAITLVFAATILTRSFIRLTGVPAGFPVERLWTGAVDAPQNDVTYEANEGWNNRFFLPLQERLRAIPDVTSVSAGNAIPFNPSGTWTERLRLPESSFPAPEAQIALALPGYFETLKIPLVRGRTFTAHDRAGAAPVAIIDEELARLYFPGVDPIGKHIGSGGETRPAEIIGIVGSVQNSDLGGPRNPEVYFPELQDRVQQIYFVARTRTNHDLTPAVRKVLAQVNPTVALYDAATMGQRISSSLKLRRFLVSLVSGFAGAGLLLAAIGLYASLAHVVQLRFHEMGIRTALGATPRDLSSFLLRDEGIALAVGVTAGLAGAIAAETLLRNQLFQAPAHDARSWASVLAVTTVCLFAAAWIPLRRASSIDPAAALRQE